MFVKYLKIYFKSCSKNGNIDYKKKEKTSTGQQKGI
jgi:hypothetical protein